MNSASRPSHLLPRLRRLMPPGSRVLVGTSGGPDSQALLHVLATSAQELGLAGVVACGVDHGLRAAAGAELDVAEALASKLGVPFVRRRVVVPTTGNVLAQARKARYAALNEVGRELSTSRLAVAHTATDQAETVLMHLARGSGLKGAGGMAFRRGALVRPLLEVTREEIMAYLASHALPFAQDPSNDDTRRARPALRHTILPALTALNPAAVQHLTAFAKKARKDERLLRSQACEHIHTEHGGLDLGALRKLPRPLASRAIMLWLEAQGLQAYEHHVTALLHGTTQRLPGGHRVGASRGRLWRLDRPVPATTPMELSGELVWRWPSFRITSRIAVRTPETVLVEAAVANLSPTRVAFDADTLHLGLQARTACAGETFAPFGLHGTVKLGDLFTNMKLPTPLRPHWPLVVSGQDVLWVVGMRRGASAPITAKTRRVLLLEVAPSEDGKLRRAF